MKVRLTKHAEERLITRTGLSKEAFITLYEKDKLLPVGKEIGSFRQHELFYSGKKKQCFVSIRDERNLQIITILPIDYHQNIAWRISGGAQLMAKNIFLEREINAIEPSQEPLSEPKVESPVLRSSRFRVVALDPFKMKRKQVTKFHSEDFAYDIDLFLIDPLFKECIKKFFIENSKDDFLQVEVIFGNREETRLLSTLKILM